MRLIAVKPFTYATRRLRAGDVFEAPDMQARLLVGIRKAQPHRAEAVLPPPPAALVAKVMGEGRPQLDHDKDGRAGGSVSPGPPQDLAALRARYFEVVGRRPFNGWDAAELQARIAEAAKG